MAYIYQVNIVLHEEALRPCPVLVSNPHGELPVDLNWSKTEKANPGGSIVYEKGATTEHPYSFLRPSKGDKWFLDFEVRNIDSSYVGRTIKGSLAHSDTYYSKQTVSGSFSDSKDVKVTGDTHVLRHEFSAQIPIGFFGRYEYTLKVLEDSENTEETALKEQSVPLELYYLSAPELPSFYNRGVPLLLLRMFLPQLQETVENPKIQDWISHVTRICFGSLTPFDHTKKETAKHWLIYNSQGAGAPSFSSSAGGVGLNLEAWLDSYRNWSKYKVYTRVNCYDQAAITEVVLSLGLHHKQIHWEYHQAYGFIKAELVGWGEVNSPYFDDVKSFRWYKEDNNKDRQPFRNHAYLSWTENQVEPSVYTEYEELMKGVPTHKEYAKRAAKFEEQKGLKFYMIDACAGPHVGSEDRVKYESGLTLIGNPADSFSKEVVDSLARDKDHWNENHLLGPGVTDWFNFLPKSSMNRYDYRVNLLTDLLKQSGSGTVKPDINQLQSSFETHMRECMGSRWTAHQKYPIRPYTTADHTSVDEIKINFSLTKEERLDRAVSLRISYNENREVLLQSLAEHLAFRAVSVESINNLVKQRESVKIGEETVAVVGTYYIRAFLWCSVAIEITIDDDNEWEARENGALQNIADNLVSMANA